ncbi:MAG: ABC-type transport auxiliary lipoprotein family protein [Candidatus Accumulibacter sp.]|jgi:cholesterol transport system auxiliary component|nr:ABC-type transport auxiliary lipoprotein family protein [Accumulibacter sp.]
MNASRPPPAARALLAALAAFLLGGCAGMTADKTPTAVYDFGQPILAAANAEAGRAGRLTLDVRAAPWLDGPRIDYRLAYGDPLRRSQYADSRWAAPPALLLAQQLRRQLGFAAADLAADCVLRVELQEFSQVFSAPRVSHGVLQGQISLIDEKRRPVASRAIAIEQAARGSDAAGGAQALVEASEELGRQLAAWLERIDREGGLETCQPAR